MSTVIQTLIETDSGTILFGLFILIGIMILFFENKPKF